MIDCHPFPDSIEGGGSMVHRKDYTPPDFLIPEIHLTFHLDPDTTRVHSRMKVRSKGSGKHQLELHSRVDELVDLVVDGESVSYQVKGDICTVPVPRQEFEVETEVILHPSRNRALEGLYLSGTILCTQNEPEGFRRITPFIDRPDNLTRITTTIVAERDRFPVLLSNGNLVESKELNVNLHSVTWEDPFPKPTYLYALVAGELDVIHDTFVTRSGREVELRIYSDPGRSRQCYHAMDALKKAMAWDEKRFGLEYDLDTYMVVAVDSFNMGAMENKGLNIFNSQYILADPDTATDSNYLAIERVVGHEYFHNWTGNRVTCRDWFQLTLKEGLTVFRDQEFSSDVQSRPVTRIQEVNRLRTMQFSEDAGPNSHPIRPDRYEEINNFYTLTVYEKGSEVIRMIHTLLGEELFMKGIDLYLRRHDGEAVTCEDFLGAMEEASGRDLGLFSRWYSQSGTPRVRVSREYDSKEGLLRLMLEQYTPATADQDEKSTLHIPLRVALVGPGGAEEEKLVELTTEKEEFFFRYKGEGVLSLNRGFTAPVILEDPEGENEIPGRFRMDDDPFNRWDAGQELFMKMIVEGKEPGDELFETIRSILDSQSDPLYRSLLLVLPPEERIAQVWTPPDFTAIHRGREHLRSTIGRGLEQSFQNLLEATRDRGEYRPEVKDAGERELHRVSLEYLAATGKEEYFELARESYFASEHMTGRMGALSVLMRSGEDWAKPALDHFYDRWKGSMLAMVKWLALQASSPLPGRAETIRELEKSDVFDERVPNLVRALYGSFSRNLVHFHARDGSGYRLIGERIRRIDPNNPQIASALAGSFHMIEKVDEERKKLMKEVLEEILDLKDLSGNTGEIVTKTLSRI